MRSIPVLATLACTISLGLFSSLLPAQSTKTSPKSAPATDKSPATPTTPHELPVRQVILYKNGVGYFEHTGQVNGNQRITVDFTTSQLNDVLQSLTVLDDNGGRIGGINYDSTTPLAQQLQSISLNMTDDPTSTQLFQALRGQRVEVTGASGGPITGRLMSIESRTGADSNSDTSRPAQTRFYLTVVGNTGAVRVIELTPTLSVRPLDPSLQGELDRYLALLSSNHSTGLRHLTLDAIGQGNRQLRVSYISEIPVWKSTYRIVFPDNADKAILQGWAVVDNTIGSDWDNVQLSLVAGAPQSFIQPLSDPLYLRRPEVPISTVAMSTPQTHQAAEESGPGVLRGTVTDTSGAVIPGAIVTATSPATGANAVAQTSSNGQFTFASLAPGFYNLTINANGFQTSIRRNILVGATNSPTVNAALTVGSASETVEVTADSIASLQMAAPARATHGYGVAAMQGMGSGAGGGIIGSVFGNGVARPTDINTNVSTNNFDDFFEYKLAQPVTIHKNESAMVPILQQTLPVERVTLWSESEAHPLRALWLENTSQLTFDSGNFSVFESGAFAGEGLLDPIHPGEKRLLSYAADQATRIRKEPQEGKREIRAVTITAQGLVQKRYGVEERTTYQASNSSADSRTVVIEVPRREDRKLSPESKPTETAANLYRFKVSVPAHQSSSVLVAEEGPAYDTWRIEADGDQTAALEYLGKEVPAIAPKIQPILDAQRSIVSIRQQIHDLNDRMTALSGDETRARENLTALKGNDAGKRFVDELNQSEDNLQSTRKQIADLTEKQKAAVDSLRQTLLTFTLDWSQPQS
ncbi:carboxypeptidase regulatory-like domain-containing protein [Acidicapsa dinghuensis]|uniref:Carboxypeptidase regulatory-like domain-containing protein n=1 Tax=Acidicapsa dinghuensis TaxID=2218256 RepID=A0ABW1ELS6_9BACT|nr:carboxypeptidase regulatory-like domain-containing protein [Acidicapsa dinghuensis]